MSMMRLRLRLKNSTIVIITSCLVFATFMVSMVQYMQPCSDVDFTEIVSANSSPGIILLWNEFFGDPNWSTGPQLGKTVFEEHKCPYSNCMLTNARGCLSKANLVLIHCADELGYRPSHQDPRQNFAVYCWEAPTEVSLEKFNNLVNITVTYRHDSDVTDYAGTIVPREEALHGPYIPRIPLKEKDSSIVWPVSHCTTHSKREDYVRELEKHIDVDIYGSCGTRECPKSPSVDCYGRFERKYKFYLSFENNLCKDYTTEKLFLPMAYELVPIVFGGADYATIAPVKSYIDIRDYKSPKHLSEYLQYLEGNDTAYYEYFQWKQTHRLEGEYLWCKLCRAIMQGPNMFRPRAAIKDLQSWWGKDACHNDDVVTKLLGS